MVDGYLISPSILSADFANLGEAIRQVENAGADWIHVDVMDGHFVPNLTMGPVVLEACRRSTTLPLDVQLMIEEPERLMASFAEAGADWVTVHVEACTHLHRTLGLIHDLGMRAGVALNPATPPIAISEALPFVDLVLVMTVEPGYSGQTFIPSMVEKVRTVREWIDERGLEVMIEVDGGVNTETAPLLAAAGAEVFVASNAIFRHSGGIKVGLHELRSALSSVPAG